MTADSSVTDKPIRTAIKWLLIFMASMLLMAFLFLITVGAYMAYGSHRADAAAKAFCASVKVGANFDDVVAAAARTSYPNRMMSPEDGQRWFAFQGGIFHAAMCKVRVQDGKVTDARVGVDDY